MAILNSPGANTSGVFQDKAHPNVHDVHDMNLPWLSWTHLVQTAGGIFQQSAHAKICLQGMNLLWLSWTHLVQIAGGVF